MQGPYYRRRVTSEAGRTSTPILAALRRGEQAATSLGAPPLANQRALEVFARTGEWHTTSYAGAVGHLTAWEINSEYEDQLRASLPCAEVAIGDSFEFLRNLRSIPTFDLLVVDNPMGFFLGHCEHFDLLPLALTVLNSPALIVLNVNFHPFDLDSQPNWKRARDSYYGRSADRLTLEDLVETYTATLGSLGWSLRWADMEIRDPRYLAYFVFVATRAEADESPR